MRKSLLCKIFAQMEAVQKMFRVFYIHTLVPVRKYSNGENLSNYGTGHSYYEDYEGTYLRMWYLPVLEPSFS